MNLLPAWWWTVVALSAAGFALLWWSVRERHRAARLRAMKRAVALCGPAESPVEQSALARLRHAPREARRHGAEASAPRFMFLGDASFMAGPGFWQWAVLPTMDAIVIDPQIVATPDAPPLRRAWCHALLALMQARRRVPLNGIVVCIDARRLRPGGTSAQPEAARLRRLMDEAARHLRLRLPVYLIVTGLERLDGYDVVRNALPGEVREQVLGQRLATDPPALAQDVFDAITSRLQALRMALLRTHPAVHDRLAIHGFVEAVRTLREGVDSVATTLFAPGDDGSPAPPWRGLYLTGSDAAGGVFSADLFARFLPADQPLATSLRRSGSAGRRN